MFHLQYIFVQKCLAVDLFQFAQYSKCVLACGKLSTYFNAVIHPLLKKDNLDPSLIGSYRPSSKLPFTAKVLEKVAVNHWTAALTTFSQVFLGHIQLKQHF